MKIELLKNTLAVSTVYSHEDNMVDYIINFGIKHGIPVIKDVYGNVYLKKGILEEGESYPCVVAHMDTVHTSQLDLVKSNTNIEIVELNNILYGVHPINETQTGIGGDDKAGVAICLDLILKTDKIIGAFFKEEEIGCLGSKKLDFNVLENIGYAIQFDAPTDNWVSYVSNRTQLFNKEFFDEIKPILKEYDIDRIHSNDPFTDIHIIKQLVPVNCINLYAGYYYQHSSDEFVKIDDVNKAVSMGNEMINKLGCKRYEMEWGPIITPIKEIITDYYEMVK